MATENENNLDSRTAADVIEGVRWEVFIFYTLRLDKTFKHSQRIEASALAWERDYKIAFPPGIGCDFILGVFSVASFAFGLAAQTGDTQMAGSMFALCGQAAVALERRFYFRDCYSREEKATLLLRANELAAAFFSQQQQAGTPFVIHPERKAD